MATSEQNPSPGLLRLHPADVVRLCGLTAVATGLELVANHRIVACQRVGSRLLATVDDTPPHDVWAEIPDEVDSAQWACDCAHAGPLACAHVAALLSAWITHPVDFHSIDADSPPEVAPNSEHPQPATTRDVSPLPTLPNERANPAADATSLAAALARMNARDVEVFARRILGSDYAEGLSDARPNVVAALSDSSQLHALLSRFDRSAWVLLTLLELAGGTMTSADLEGLSLRLGLPLSALQRDVAVLERHMLLLAMLPASVPSQHGSGSSWRHVAGWRIPDEVRRAFPAPLPLDALPVRNGSRLAPPLLEPQGTPLRVIRSAPRTLCLALALLANAPPPLGLPQAVAAADSASVPVPHSAGLLAPGEIMPERLKRLAQSAGLDVGAVRLARRLLRQGRGQHPDSPILDMARLPAMERPLVLRAAFRRWLRSESAADLLDIELAGDVRVRYATAHPGFRPSAIAREVSDGRRFIIRLLSHAQPDSWYALDSFTSLAWQVHPGLLRGQQQAWATPAWWLESAAEKRALQPHVHDDWLAAEGAFIRTIIAGACATWGMVDLATRPDGNIAAFRLTPFGAYLLQRDNSPADAALVALCDDDWGPPVLPLHEGALAVQPLAAGTNLLDALPLWATPTAVSGRRLVYTLSPDRACAAFDQQLSPSSLLAILRPLHSRAAESVANRLNQWHAQWGHARITTGFTLLEASDEAALMEALAVAPDIAARCRRVGPALALALPDDAAALRTLLARRGYAV